MARPKNEQETTSLKFAVRADLKQALLDSLEKDDNGNVRQGCLKAWLEKKLIKEFGNGKNYTRRGGKKDSS